MNDVYVRSINYRYRVHIHGDTKTTTCTHTMIHEVVYSLSMTSPLTESVCQILERGWLKHSTHY